MNIARIAAIAVLIAFGPAAAQEVEKKVELKVVVAGDGDGTEINWVGDGTDLEGLAVGESRTLTGESGREITVTRTGEGMQFQVDGETVVLPDLGMAGHHMAFVDTSGGQFDVEVLGDDSENVDVKVISGGAHVMQAHHPDGVTIISDEPLDESVRESIRSVLISAGKDGDVTFIDGNEHAGGVKVIKKRVEVTN